jgi:predicted membrane channel-forming protein YqfA (hemolysin III family)
MRHIVTHEDMKLKQDFAQLGYVMIFTFIATYIAVANATSVNLQRSVIFSPTNAAES